MGTFTRATAVHFTPTRNSEPACTAGTAGTKDMKLVKYILLSPFLMHFHISHCRAKFIILICVSMNLRYSASNKARANVKDYSM